MNNALEPDSNLLPPQNFQSSPLQSHQSTSFTASTEHHSTIPHDQRYQQPVPTPFVLQLSRLHAVEQHLWELGNTYFNHAKSNQYKITSKKNLLEYYSLIQLSLLCFEKITRLDQSATLRVKLKANLKIAEILMAESFDSDSFGDEHNQPEYYIDQVILLTKNNLSYINFNAHAYYLLTKRFLQNDQPKQILKLIDQSYLENSSLFKFLKFRALSCIDPFQALRFLQSFIDSQEFLVLNDDTKLFFQLAESNFALEKGVASKVDLNSIKTTSQIQLEVSRQFTLVLYELSHGFHISLPKQNNPYQSLTSRLKNLGSFLTTYREQLEAQSFSLYIPFINGIQAPISIASMNYPVMNIFFYLVFGVSTLHMSFENRGSLKTFEQCSSMIDQELSKYSKFAVSIKNNQSDINRLLKLKKLTLFYTMIESSISEKISEDSLTRIINEISPNKDTINTVYLRALNFQQKGDLKMAKTQYYSVINHLKQRKESKYTDVYIICHLNVLAIIESDLSYFSRTSNNTQYALLNPERSAVLSEIHSIQNSKNSTIKSKYLIELTLNFLQILYNYDSLSILDQNAQISTMIDSNFDNIKKFTILASSLLYMKSSTLNKNSDQRQKSSQLSFNLAKMGYMPLLRYLSGSLNANNANIARNLQQYEVQRQKLEKIQKNLDPDLLNIHQT